MESGATATIAVEPPGADGQFELASMLAMCVLTVSVLRPRRMAISGFGAALAKLLENPLLGRCQDIGMWRTSAASSWLTPR